MDIDFTTLHWLNPPPRHQASAEKLSLHTGPETDFWHGTFYGFTPHNGHFGHVARSGSFAATLTFDAAYRELYDQCGLLLRADDRHWIKAGVEYTDGARTLSVVVTNGLSDWSKTPLTGTDPVTLRLTRFDDSVKIEHVVDGRAEMVRLCPFSGDRLQVGPYACTPKRAGLQVEFTGFRIEPDPPRAIH